MSYFQTDNAEIRASYALIAMCSHDCAPNAISCIDSRMGRSHRRRAFEHELRHVQ